jgi:hypothetical protein
MCCRHSALRFEPTRDNSRRVGNLPCTRLGKSSRDLGTILKSIGAGARAFFFVLSYGLQWSGSTRPEMLQELTSDNPHSHPKYRVNGVVLNMPQFQRAFGCKKGQPMVRDNACRYGEEILSFHSARILPSRDRHGPVTELVKLPSSSSLDPSAS